MDFFNQNFLFPFHVVPVYSLSGRWCDPGGKGPAKTIGNIVGLALVAHGAGSVTIREGIGITTLGVEGNPLGEMGYRTPEGA